MGPQLHEIDRDGALAEASEALGLTRKQALRRSAGAVAGVGAAGVMLGAPAFAGAKSKATDRKVLQFALAIEHLGVTFYSLAVDGGRLSGRELQFAQTLLGHETEHLAVLSAALRGLGGTPAAPPSFHFGSIPHDPARFRATAQAIEELCVEVVNGAGPLVTRPTLAVAGTLVSVEAAHVSWIRQISGVTPVPNAFDTTKTTAQAKRIVRAKGFVKSF